MRVVLVLTGLLLLTCGCDAIEGVSDRDNTAVNQRDANGEMQTPFDQSNDQSDIDLVAELRMKVLEIENLSVDGRNIKIITNQGKVVLRGPVASTAEHDHILAVVNQVAGGAKVDDQLEVKAD